MQSHRSETSLRFKRIKTVVPIESQSLKRFIDRLNQDSQKTTAIGVASVSPVKIPKRSSYYQSRAKTTRISQVSQEPKFDLASLNSQPRQFLALKQYTKSSAVADVSKKFFLGDKNHMQNLLSKCGFSMTSLMEKTSKCILKQKENFKEEIKKEVQQRIPIRKRSIPYEMDTFFKNYKGYSSNYIRDNQLGLKQKQYNVINKIYTEAQNEDIYYKFKEQAKEESDDSIQFDKYMNNLNPEDVQRDVHQFNIRNPFLEDRATVRAMKLSGLLQRRQTEI